MDQRSSRAETLPALYRSILDDVGELERIDRRDIAARARRDAARAYAVWDDRAERRLLRVKADIGTHLRGRSTNQRRTPWRRAPDRLGARAGDGRAASASIPDTLPEQAPTS